MRIENLNAQGDFRLEDGRVLRLVGISWPTRHVPEERAKLVHRIRHEISDGRMILSLAGGADRWNHWPAHLMGPAGEGARPRWLQQMLLEEGWTMAWTDSTTPPPCWQELLTAEQQARQMERGIWSQRALTTRQTAARLGAGDPLARRMVFEGRVLTVRKARSVSFVNFEGPRALTPSWAIPHRQLATYRKAGRDPATFVGQRLRIRGELEAGQRPKLSVAGPHMIEVIEDQRK